MPRVQKRFTRLECPKFHKMTPGNTTPDGRCRECVRSWTGYKGNPVNRNKTTCPDGHSYEGANLGIYKRGKYRIRYCKACQANRASEYYWRVVKSKHPGDRGRPRKSDEQRC